MQIVKTMLVAVVLLLVSMTASAEDFAREVVVSADGKIVVAVHPYTSRKERKLIKILSDGEKKSLIPVGVMIQNYSDKALSTYRNKMHVKDSKQGGRGVVKMSPFSRRRPLGGIAGPEFHRDVCKMNREVRDAYAPREALLNPTMNEVYYAPWIAPKETYYGLIYIERKDEKERNRRIHSLEGLELYVPLIQEDMKDVYRAKIPLSSEGEGKIARSPRLLRMAHEGVKKIYIGPSEKRPTDDEIYRRYMELMRCDWMGSSGAEIGRVSDRHYIRAYLEYDECGNVVSEDIVRVAGGLSLERKMKKWVDGMKECELHFGAAESTQCSNAPYYRYSMYIGNKLMEVAEKE